MKVDSSKAVEAERLRIKELMQLEKLREQIFGMTAMSRAKLEHLRTCDNCKSEVKGKTARIKLDGALSLEAFQFGMMAMSNWVADQLTLRGLTTDAEAEISKTCAEIQKAHDEQLSGMNIFQRMFSVGGGSGSGDASEPEEVVSATPHTPSNKKH